MTEVDALDQQAVDSHLATVQAAAGRVDISFNLINIQERQGLPLTTMSLDDFARPINIAMRTQFLTCTAAARAMVSQGSGVILTLTATPGGIGTLNFFHR